MARSDRLDAHRGEIGPEHARTGELEAWCHEHALDHLVRIVLQREGDPARARAGLAGLHLDAPHDAIGVTCGLDLEAILAGLIGLDRREEVDRFRLRRNANGIQRAGGCQRCQQCQKQQQHAHQAQWQRHHPVRGGEASLWGRMGTTHRIMVEW